MALGPSSITYTGEVTATALVTDDMVNPKEGCLRIKTGSVDQTIFLVPRVRRFGGYQWYFVCPVMNRCASVLWRPPGTMPASVYI